MRNLKWIVLCVACMLLISYVVSGTFGDGSGERSEVKIVNIFKERNASSELVEFTPKKHLIPAVYKGELPKPDYIQKWTSNGGDYSDNLYNVPNVIDKFCFVENKGNANVYIRTWFAFELGSMTLDEFKAAVYLNRNTTAWDWWTESGELNFSEITIENRRYAMTYATYKDPLPHSQITTHPSLLQVLMYNTNTVTNEDAKRLDGNNDGLYDVEVFSIANTTEDYWGTDHPWNNNNSGGTAATTK